MSDSRHHLRSVSDLYAADEIEVLLLEEIRDLEPPSAYSRPEDIQDFEIAGSRTGGRISSQSSELDSPGIHSTVHSWDSHANYHCGQGRHGSLNGLQWPRSSHVVLYCDIQGHLKTSTGVIRLLLLISSAACLVTLCSSGTAKVSLFMLPLVGRLRFMIFVAVFCLLVTSLLLFLDISHIIYFFPLNWPRLNTWMFTGLGVSYVVSSALLVSSVLEYHGGGWVPRRTRSQLSATAGLGLSCALLSFLLSWIHGRGRSTCKAQSGHEDSVNQQYKPVDNSTSSGATLKEKSPNRWTGKSQQSKKRDSDNANANNSHRGNSYENRFQKGNRKDHWASARQHFLNDDDDNDDVQKDDNDTERKRRRKKRDETSIGGNGSLSASKTGTSISLEESKPRRVPQKLPLKNIDRPQSRSTPKNTATKSSATVKTSKSQSNDIQAYWSTTETRQIEVTENGLNWEAAEPTAAASANISKSDAIDITEIKTTMWTEKWRPPPDDVQPCSSKTVDPYTFA